MRKSVPNRKRIASWLLSALALSIVPVTGWAAPRITVTPASQSIGLHEPVQVEVAVWNSDAAPLAWIGGQAMEGDTHLDVVYPDGRREKLGPPKWARRPDVMSAFSKVTIAPGQAYRQTILLQDWLPFDREGKYTITLSLRGAASPVIFYVDIGPPKPR